jgi:non-ribosomal peptide synthetase component E (peptide arylation enzyme)
VGLFVDAEIRGRRVDDIISLPRSVLRDGNRVLVVDDDDRLHYRTIEPLRLYRDRVLSRTGLRSGERVCVSPIQTVVEGMRVDPVAEPV